MPKPFKPLVLDGRTGEGGGQLVRLACALSAVLSLPIRIINVRGNRAGLKRGGGLKAQHVSSIAWLARVTDAKVKGLEIGSHTLDFAPSLPPTALRQNRLSIDADSAAASTLLIFQAVLPYLLFASNVSNADEPKAVELEIKGGTNVSYSLSFEYLDQVLLPTLEDNFGIKIERRLDERGWSMGPLRKGAIWFRIQPLGPGAKLALQRPWHRVNSDTDFELQKIDASILAPGGMHSFLHEALVKDLGTLFPHVDVNFVITEESGHDSRMYVLVVAHSKTGLRWGRDCLYDKKRKNKTLEDLSDEISRKVSDDLYKEVALRGVVDEYLQDQLVVFQSLAEGVSGFKRDGSAMASPPHIDINGVEVQEPTVGHDERMREDKTSEPFGQGSTHTTTARWVTAELLGPRVKWFNNGNFCKGAGISFT